MAKAGLTVKQHKVYSFIRMCIKEKGASPSYEEIREGLNLPSKSYVYDTVWRLRERGYIDFIPGRSRSIFLMDDVEKAEKNRLKAVQAAARLYFNAKSEWDKLYAENPNHPDNQNVLAPRVMQTHSELKRLVLGE